MTQWTAAVNDPTVLQKKLAREFVLDGIRRFFKERNYREVETPLFTLTPDPEPTIEPFEASEVLANGKQIKGYLITSPEFAMKRILAAGSGSIFQITKAFRSLELPGSKHNGEFTILEWYATGQDYRYVMDECLQLLQYVVGFLEQSQGLGKSALFEPVITPASQLEYHGVRYDLNSLEKISYTKAMEQYAGVSEAMIFDRSLLAEHMRKLAYEVKDEYTLLDLLSLLYVDKVEPNLGAERPTVIYDYPADQAGLSQKKVNDPRYAERFEWYLGGVELGNAFTELTDVTEQKQRFTTQLAERRTMGHRSWEPDSSFLQALEHGMPRVAGIAVGVDRLAMVLLDAPEIAQTLWFPEQDWVFGV